MSSCCMRVRVVESHKVSPPPNSVSSPTLLPLTFSDAFWIPFSDTQKLFIYNFPSISTSYFINSFLPALKTSLSLSLHHFFPLAGSFTPPAHPTDRPCIRYEDGCFVALTVAEATGDFSHLTDKRRLINATEFHPLVPDLSVDDVTGRTSVLALQFTVFPDCGICFGITYKHVVADGKSISAFLSAWSSICNNRCVLPPNTVLPIIDRSLIPDPPNGFCLDSYLKQIFEPKDEGKKPAAGPSEAKVRGTFVITRSEIEKLRQWVLKRAENENLHLSTFVLTCSLIWVNLIKSEAAVRKPNVDATDVCRFGQVVDCRDRYEFKSIVPSAYFGNCLAYGCLALAKRTELEGEDGFVVAVRAMGNRIKKLDEEGALTEAQSWLADINDLCSTGSVFTVAGSPRLGVYGLEFGWGRPDRVEVVSIDSSSSISIAESADGEGGVEIGLVLGMPQMQAFVSIHEESKYILCRSY
uniref:Uncharacterized protein n=1 Tax=Kalanchoe fedtschenkoi TaxID=63787 RepID=A0A7N0V6T3_KALFE